MGLKNIKDYFDNWGMISQINPKGVRDGGDACNRNSCYNFAIWFNSRVLGKNWRHFDLPYTTGPEIRTRNRKCFNKSVPVRHPDPKKWYSEIDRFSRDQSIPFLINLFLFNKVLAEKFFWLHAKHLWLFTWNTKRNHATIHNHGDYKYPSEPSAGTYNYGWKLPDITGPEFWSIYVRGFGLPKIFLYPLDFFNFLNAYSKKFSNDDDVINFITKMAYCHAVKPTFFITWSIKITDWADIDKKMYEFFKPEFEPPMDVVYSPIINYLLNV